MTRFNEVHLEKWCLPVVQALEASRPEIKCRLYHFQMRHWAGSPSLSKPWFPFPYNLSPQCLDQNPKWSDVLRIRTSSAPLPAGVSSCKQGGVETTLCTLLCPTLRQRGKQPRELVLDLTFSLLQVHLLSHMHMPQWFSPSHLSTGRSSLVCRLWKHFVDIWIPALFRISKHLHYPDCPSCSTESPWSWAEQKIWSSSFFFIDPSPGYIYLSVPWAILKSYLVWMKAVRD
jgi:hypothetical protein